MKRGVVQNHDLARLKNRTQLALEPFFDQLAVAIALERQGRQDVPLARLVTPPSRRHRDTRGAVPQLLPQAPKASRTPTPGKTQRVFHTRLVHIHPLFTRNAF